MSLITNNSKELPLTNLIKPVKDLLINKLLVDIKDKGLLFLENIITNKLAQMKNNN